jgi:hypothetical protein
METALAYQKLLNYFNCYPNLYSNIEYLVLWARPEILGSAIDIICMWFQVSGVRCQWIQNPEH